MSATWFQGSASDFIKVTKEGWDKGVSILHFLGGTSIDLAGERAIRTNQDDDLAAGPGSRRGLATWCAPAASSIFSRNAPANGASSAAADLLKKDRIDPVDPAAVLKLDRPSWRNIPKVIGISPTSRKRSVIASNATCPGRRTPKSRRSMPRAARGWRRRRRQPPPPERRRASPASPTSDLGPTEGDLLRDARPHEDTP